ncbi:MAG: response regulator [Gloeomargaritaceae cyanobacterium C42_A2020_066]|nr:response regulator [Gloeomargaritaceae cyanobacterium C42_A2020_066]
MQPEQHQRILGYFIEEAREHIETLDRGLKTLPERRGDQEFVAELYRAAHSVKGGAAMLGLPGIQKVALGLENCLKVVRDHQPPVDPPTVALFLQGLQALCTLHAHVETHKALDEETAQQTWQAVEPVFKTLKQTLDQMSGGVEVPAAVPMPAPAGMEGEMAAGLVDLFGSGSQPPEDVGLAELFAEASPPEALEAAGRNALDDLSTLFAELASETEGVDMEVQELESLADLFGTGGEMPTPEPGLVQPTVPDLNALDAVPTGDLWANLDLESLEAQSAHPPGTGEDAWQDLLAIPEVAAPEPRLVPGESELPLDEALAVEGGAMEPASDQDLASFLAEVDQDPALLQTSAELDDALASLDALALEEVPSAISEAASDHDLAELATFLDAPTSAAPEHPEAAADLANLEDLLGSPAPQRAVALVAETGGGEAGRAMTGALLEQSMRVPVRQLDNLNNLIGELVVSRNALYEDQQRLRQFLENLLYQAQQLNDLSQRVQDLYERSLLEGALSAGRQQTGMGSGGGESSQHTTGAEFDALEMDRFTGFHVLSQEIAERVVRVRESAADIQFMAEAFDEVTRSFQRITTSLQEGITQARMEPFARIADRLPRAVRNIALKYGKQVNLQIEGRDTLIDKMILENLTDPMTHLVNNAIVHGIGLPAQRQSAGRSPAGRIVIRAAHQGNQTVITVSDDGVGINPERVKAKALERGVITPEQVETLSRSEIYNLLFLPGFTTKDQADEFAGRGVGLDVVRTKLAEIRGTVTVDSQVGQGTTFTIRLPLTLSISKALCCLSSHARIAFPMDGVEDVLDIQQPQVRIEPDGSQTIHWKDRQLLLRPLQELLRYNRQISRSSMYGSSTTDDLVSVVILSSLGRYVAIQVDQILNEQEVVIKQLAGPVSRPPGIAGATVLGDGRIMTIADIMELVDMAVGQLAPPTTPVWQVPTVQEVPPEEPTVLIVDDSITVRELLSMTFSSKGYRVEQARDGQEAWEKLKDGLPCDMVFCDIEMPRMDGLEFLSRVRRDSDLKQLPIAMLTSRGAERHRQMAIQLGASAYFTKPYLEENLLDAARRLLRGEVLVGSGSVN